MTNLRFSGIVFTAGLLVVGCGSSDSGQAHGQGSGTGASGSGAAGGFLSTGSTSGMGGSGVGGSAAGGAGVGGAGAGGAGAGGSGVGGAGAGGSGVGGSGASGGVVTSVTPVADANACVADKVDAQQDVLDIFIMQDRSGSMGDATSSGDSKWTVITNAITGFVQDPLSSGIGAGIGFFANQASCNAADYAIPSVGIAPLNGNAAPIVNAIQAITPNGNTPTEPALDGPIQ